MMYCVLLGCRNAICSRISSYTTCFIPKHLGYEVFLSFIIIKTILVEHIYKIDILSVNGSDITDIYVQPMRDDVRSDFLHLVTRKEQKHDLQDLTPFDRAYLEKKRMEDEQIYSINKNLRKAETMFTKKKSMSKKAVILDNLCTELLPHQKHGLNWMLNCEHSHVRGGILADEMGLGKTLQTLSLILTGKNGEINLVVAPVISLGQWKTEIEKHTRDINIITKDGQKVLPGQINVILTSYGKLENLFRRNKNKMSKYQSDTPPVLNNYKCNSEFVFAFSDVYMHYFDRIILDEIHIIKDSRASTNMAVTRLNGNVRWGLTGTPVQNRIGDLYSLIKFLRLDPLACYLCKKCKCISFNWLNGGSRKGFCSCGHYGALHFGWWNRKVVAPARHYGLTTHSKKIFAFVKRITSHFILRRTKKQLEKELGLPSKQMVVIRSYFSQEEKDFYECIYKKVKSKFNVFIHECDTSYINIFTLIQKLRLAANHPFLLSNKCTLVCSICFEEAFDPIQSKCGHVFCKSEAEIYFLKNNKCPACHTKITICFPEEDVNFNVDPKTKIDEILSNSQEKTCGLSKNRDSHHDDSSHFEKAVCNGMNESLHKNNFIEFAKNRFIDINKWRSSTKIETLMEVLYEIQSCKERSSEKSIVFSQFVNFLEILAWRMERSGFRCAKIYGSMLLSQRETNIRVFQTNSDVNILLISLKAGGLALNLTEANNVFLMDPWWNPAVEEQAMDRIHRIGQFRPIRIYKIIIEDSIESKILELQKKKKALFNLTVENDCNALEKLQREDMLFLFN